MGHGTPKHIVTLYKEQVLPFHGVASHHPAIQHYADLRMGIVVLKHLRIILIRLYVHYIH